MIFEMVKVNNDIGNLPVLFGNQILDIYWWEFLSAK